MKTSTWWFGFTSMLALLLALTFAQAQLLRIDAAPPGRLDPHVATDYVGSILMFNVYDPFLYPDPETIVRPHLAERWHISDDGLTYTFELREGVQFHDGRELTADDVVFSFDRLLTMGRGFSYLFAGRIERVEALDTYTVAFTLTEPFAPFLATLTRLIVVNSELVRENLADGPFGELGDYGEAFLATTGAGSGAYQVESHEPTELTVLRRFDGYFLEFAPKAPDTVRIHYGLETATVRTLMARGEHEITSQWHPPELFRALAAMDNVDLITESGQVVLFMHINTARPPTDDPHFRRAMARAFDYEAVLSALQITDEIVAGKLAYGPLPEGFPGFDATLGPQVQDLELAQAELAQAAYAPGEHTVEICWVTEVPFEETIALIFQQNMGALGIPVDVVGIPWAVMVDRATSAETTCHIGLVYIGPTYPDPDAMLYPMYHSGAAGTYYSMSWLQEPEIDELLDQSRATLDEEERMAIFAELQQRITALQPDIYAYEEVTVFARQSYVRVPMLEEPGQKVPVTGANWLFRLIEVDN